LIEFAVLKPDSCEQTTKGQSGKKGTENAERVSDIRKDFKAVELSLGAKTIGKTVIEVRIQKETNGNHECG
jgi:hypothetical protein